jgi:hypothetical protein
MKSDLNQPQAWTRENLEKALKTAIAVELFTIPVYLSAASSIKEEARLIKNIRATIHEESRDNSDDSDQHFTDKLKEEYFSAYDTIMSVVVQEMFHLTMACNLANAMGVRPDITAPDLLNPPSCLKGIHGKPVKGNLNALLDTMLAIEAPDPKYEYNESPNSDNPANFHDGPKLFQEEYDSIGDLYHALAYGIEEFWNYDPANDAYQKVNFESKYPHVNPIIRSLNDAWNAIAAITEQGEGNGAEYGFMPDDYVPAPGQQFHDLDEISHWQRFHDIKVFMNGGGVIPQYEEHESDVEETATAKLTEIYSKVINQLNEDFVTPDAPLNLRGMASTGRLATAIWQYGKVPQWDYTPSPAPWPEGPKFPHACQGLNACKGQDYSGNNNCAGSGACATAIDHSCQYTNVCRSQGGCGYPGKSPAGAPSFNPNQNSCAGNGGCQSPISPNQYFNFGEYSGQTVWDVARKMFEESYSKANPGKTLNPVGEVTERRKGVIPTNPKK